MSPEELRAGMLTVVTNPPNSAGMDALGGGVLHGRDLGDHACFWLGSGENAFALAWPAGFAAAADPLRIVGPDDQDLAAVGSVVALGGGAFPGYVPTPIQDPCEIGQLFVVSSVVSVDGRVLNVGEGSLKLETRPPGAIADCPVDPLPNAMLVMRDGRLQLRIDDATVPATWPNGFSAVRGDRLGVVDADGSVIVLQGVETKQLRGVISGDRIDVCGLADVEFP
jgi:hypothetical protein